MILFAFIATALGLRPWSASTHPAAPRTICLIILAALSAAFPQASAQFPLRLLGFILFPRTFASQALDERQAYTMVRRAIKEIPNGVEEWALQAVVDYYFGERLALLRCIEAVFAKARAVHRAACCAAARRPLCASLTRRQVELGLHRGIQHWAGMPNLAPCMGAGRRRCGKSRQSVHCRRPVPSFCVRRFTLVDRTWTRLWQVEDEAECPLHAVAAERAASALLAASLPERLLADILPAALAGTLLRRPAPPSEALSPADAALWAEQDVIEAAAVARIATLVFYVRAPAVGPQQLAQLVGAIAAAGALPSSAPLALAQGAVPAAAAAVAQLRQLCAVLLISLFKVRSRLLSPPHPCTRSAMRVFAYVLRMQVRLCMLWSAFPSYGLSSHGPLTRPHRMFAYALEYVLIT